MNNYCELSKEQFEAALNFLRHVQAEREGGREIDLSRLHRIIVRRDPNNRSKVEFEVELELPKAA